MKKVYNVQAKIVVDCVIKVLASDAVEAQKLATASADEAATIAADILNESDQPDWGDLWVTDFTGVSGFTPGATAEESDDSPEDHPDFATQDEES